MAQAMGMHGREASEPRHVQCEADAAGVDRPHFRSRIAIAALEKRPEFRLGSLHNPLSVALATHQGAS
jgi:hypothetical protein